MQQHNREITSLTFHKYKKKLNKFNDTFIFTIIMHIHNNFRNSYITDMWRPKFFFYFTKIHKKLLPFHYFFGIYLKLQQMMYDLNYSINFIKSRLYILNYFIRQNKWFLTKKSFLIYLFTLSCNIVDLQINTETNYT